MPVTCTNYKLKCGGCPLLNQPYPDQLKRKQQLEQRLLGRFAPVSPVLGQAEPWHYRNKAIATFATGPRGRLTCGIYAAGTHRVLPYTDCLLQDTVINQTIAAVLEAARACRWPAFEEDRGTGLLRHVLVRRGKTSGQVLVVLVTAQENLPGSRNFVKALREKAPWVTSVVQNCNPRRTSAVLGSDVRTLYGPGKITDTLCGLQFAISPRSFYQVNPEQTEVLYAKAIEFAALTGKETVIDAYCGIGTIGLCAAGRAKQVIGVERNPDAVRNACANAAANKINNARFICADATDWMRAAAQPNSGLPHPDVVFLDPPREGSTPACIDAVAAMKPKRVVYVSCNPETLARDLTHLTRRGWKALKIQPVDMFPHTEHVETVVLLSKGEVDSKKIRVEFSLEDMDMSEFQDGATYPQIKEYVLEHTGLKVSNLYISQIKRKCGIEVGKNYNLPKSDDSRQPQCPPEKEKAIREAFEYFEMIYYPGLRRFLMDRLISCAFNMDNACVELKFFDGSMIAIDTIAVENEVADNMNQRSELDYLIYNDPVGYADLILNGDPETYLKIVTEYKSLDS